MFGLEPASVRDDIEDALEEAGTNADFTPQERAILKNVLALHEVRVADAPDEVRPQGHRAERRGIRGQHFAFGEGLGQRVRAWA